ncbi:putative ATP-dependent RNA helicase DDX46, partial [Trichoplax sp. H2]
DLYYNLTQFKHSHRHTVNTDAPHKFDVVRLLLKRFSIVSQTFNSMGRDSESRKRHRSRSRSKERKRRSRSRERKSRRSRSRSHERKRHHRHKHREKDKKRRSKSRERKTRKRSRSSSSSSGSSSHEYTSKSKEKKNVNNASKETEKANNQLKEPIKDTKEETSENANDLTLEQDALEEEMRKRRERVEAWQRIRKVQLDEQKKVTTEDDEEQKGKKWTLEDDDDDDEAYHDSENEDDIKEEELKDPQMEIDKDTKDAEINDEAKDDQALNSKDDEDDIDPLDAFMESINSEAKSVQAKDQARIADSASDKRNQKLKEIASGKRFITVTGVAKKKTAKGELMSNDQDAMEYSSEEDDQTLEDLMEKKKKDVNIVDHSKIYYAPFKRNFYVEVPELAKMTSEEADDVRLQLENIKVRGKGCPTPVKNWAQCGLSVKLLDSLKRVKYEKPTPVQAQAIPSIMSGRDVIGIAKTGSGKTLAFLLPMFRHILDQNALSPGDGPIGLIMTPTRELAIQITRECRRFTKAIGMHVVCVYGGTGISEQIAELKRGAEIVVCTPGRMIDMLLANNGRVTNLRRVTYLVLDEADRMFDMGFEPQVMKIVESIRPDRQTVMFSATFPRQMEALARKMLTKPIEIEVGGRSIVCSDIEQHVVIINEEDKFLKLLELLGLYQPYGSVLVFVEKQESSDQLLKDLMKASYPCLSLHGGMDQSDRDSTIVDYKNGVIKLLVATSVAARGLDVKNLILVVNYDCPNHYEDYVHRAGRTGRAGNKGYAYTLITEDQGKYAGDIIRALELSKNFIPESLEKLWSDYKEELKAQGKHIAKNRGFSGKGFKFDEAERAQMNEFKKQQKKLLGLEDSDEEDDDEVEVDQQIDEIFNSTGGIKETVSSGLISALSSNSSETTASQASKLAKAAESAAQILAKKNIGKNLDATQRAAARVLKGEAVTAISGFSKANLVAERINARLNYIAPEKEEEESADTQATGSNEVTRYSEELPINDFPQNARWKITSKDTISDITELSECSITVRGTYFPPGKEPGEGQRKIYLYLEGPNERSVQIATAEIKRILKEEILKAKTMQSLRPGRYKVL